MKQQRERKWRELRNQLISESDPNRVLEILLALDRRVVELSMRIYKIPRRDRSRMRAQNQRLHEAVRGISLEQKAYLYSSGLGQSPCLRNRKLSQL